MEQTNPTDGQKTHTKFDDFRVHHVLAYSYSVYFTALIVGLLADMVIKVPHGIPFSPFVGFIFLLLGTVFVVWAQSTSQKTHKPRTQESTLSMSQFAQGPYVISRSPTHVGLFFLLFGLGLLMNSLIILLVAILALFLTRFIFITKEEKLLEEKYGQHYLEYKNSKKFWL